MFDSVDQRRCTLLVLRFAVAGCVPPFRAGPLIQHASTTTRRGFGVRPRTLALSVLGGRLAVSFVTFGIREADSQPSELIFELVQLHLST